MSQETSTPVLQTTRLRLRPWGEEDADALYRFARDPMVCEGAGFPPHQSPEDSRHVIRDILAVPNSWAITLLGSNPYAGPVGAIALRVGDASSLGIPDDEADLGYWLGRPLWGEGYATEACRAVLSYGFRSLGLAAVWAAYYEGNERSRRVQDRLGLSPHHRNEGVTDAAGRVRDENVQRITRSEWEQTQAADPQSPDQIERQQRQAGTLVEGIRLVARIRSGGQTGADRGGLDAARELGTPICGWCPPNGLAEDYPQAPGVMAPYPELRPSPSEGYVERTAWNVRDSHATLIVAPAGLEPKSGTEMTERFARAYGRPCLVVRGASEAGKVAEWLRGIGTGLTLNVAGPRESKLPGIYRETRNTVDALLRLCGWGD